MDGQLGHGDQRRFSDHPKRVKDRHISGKVIQISCGETYSAAVTGLCYINAQSYFVRNQTKHL